jgi:Domain of unknown function (DUF5710)
MDRIFLYVAPEEYAEVKALGARWEDDTKRWYIDARQPPASFSRWLKDDPEEEFGLSSDQARVASATVPCVLCRKPIQVICIYCDTATDRETGDPVTQVTVSNVWTMDEALRRQLTAWPQFRLTSGAGPGAELYNNHCPHCGAVQQDYMLHSEPGDVFFGLSLSEPGSVEFTSLLGRIELSGDFGFEV